MQTGSLRIPSTPARLRIEKLDSETHENLLHDGALIYDLQGGPEIKRRAKVQFYEEETVLTGSEEFLKAMGASDIKPLQRGEKPLQMGRRTALEPYTPAPYRPEPPSVRRRTKVIPVRCRGKPGRPV